MDPKEIELGWTVKEKIGGAICNPKAIKTDLSIVIVAFNAWNYTRSCLENLFKLPFACEIIVIDNASSDKTQEELLKINYPKFKYIRNEENLFHSKACNQGFAVSSGNNILFLNNDIKIAENIRETWHLSIIEACQDGSIVGPTMGLLNDKLEFVKEANQQLEGNSYISGWCIAAQRETWNKISNNGFIWSEDIKHYYNDADISFRARQKNLKLRVIDIPGLVHLGKKSSTNQKMIGQLYTEGKKLFIEKWIQK